MTEVCCLKRGDVFFFKKGMQLGPGSRGGRGQRGDPFKGGQREPGKKSGGHREDKGGQGMRRRLDGNIVNSMVEMVEYCSEKMLGVERYAHRWPTVPGGRGRCGW